MRTHIELRVWVQGLRSRVDAHAYLGSFSLRCKLAFCVRERLLAGFKLSPRLVDILRNGLGFRV